MKELYVFLKEAAKSHLVVLFWQLLVMFFQAEYAFLNLKSC